MLYRKQQQQPSQTPILAPPPEVNLPYGQVNLINDFRGLWAEIIIWMRSYIAAVAAQYPNTDAITERISEIPVAFHDRLELIFGKKAAEGFLNLLTNHTILTEKVIDALKNGDQNSVNMNTAALYKNADEIAKLLREINPFWSEVQWRNLLYTYISLNLQEAVAFLSNDFEEDIDIYDRLIAHSQLLGNYMADGIIRYLLVSRPV